MSLLRQLLLALVAVAAALGLWIAFLPAAHPLLERAGILDLLGVEAADPGASAGGGRGWGGGGPATVIAEEVRAGRIQDAVSAIGDGRAARAATLRAEATGRVTQIGYTAGAEVAADSVVVRLDDEAERIALERARLMLADAEDEVARLSQLEGSGAVTAVRYREAELARRTAELEVRAAEFELQRRVIRAPFAGRLGIVEVDVGDRVTAQETLAVLTDRSELMIDFRVPERVVSRIMRGMAVTVRPAALDTAPIAGRVSAVDNVVDRASRTLRVQATVPNAGDRLRAGMAFEVRLPLPGASLPAVDPLAVQWSSDGAFVWAVREGRAVRVPVTIRERNADSVLVEAELTVGEQVVTEGVQSLRPGAEVRVSAPAGAARGAAAPPRRG